jgi:sirohydrochlorin ferrochelatase
MRAVILLGHGSRVPEAGRDMERIAEEMRRRSNEAVVEICYMSQLGPHFPEAFGKCMQRGATEVIVIPYFLHLGQHMRADIPAILQEEAQKFPNVRVVLGKNLGFDLTLVNLVEKRVRESLDFPDVRQLEVAADEHECKHEHKH